MGEGVWSECFRRALWLQTGEQSGKWGTREEAAARVHRSMELAWRRLRPIAPHCAELSMELGSGERT